VLVRGRGVHKLILKKQGGRLWNEFLWLRIEIPGGLMGKRDYLTFGRFHKMGGIAGLC